MGKAGRGEGKERIQSQRETLAWEPESGRHTAPAPEMPRSDQLCSRGMLLEEQGMWLSPRCLAHSSDGGCLHNSPLLAVLPGLSFLQGK